MSKLSKQDIVRAWKDANFRKQLTPEQQAALPDSPAGVVELTSDELTEVAGGRGHSVTSIPCQLDDLGFTNNTFPCCKTQDITCESGVGVGGRYSISR